ncbi:MAG: DUF5916 domain-containing protein [Acidobacteria bacterium]|nr:DUF5916 domain-containing protein [Acidobacteriota bacterium]
MRTLLGVSIIVMLASGAGIAAQSPPADRPVATASQVSEAPALDGDVLGDPVWNQIAPAGNFWQTTPDDGVPASERTEVRIAYTDTTLYVGVVLYDSSPATVVAADSRRDSPLDATDSIQFILDTFRNGQSGFVFGTNPAGIEYDGQVANEGQGGFGAPSTGLQQGGAGGGFNLNWDGAWEVRTQVGDYGWSAEFAIPFRTLRYRSREDTWSLNVQRNINRRNEVSYWAPLNRQYNLYRLVDAGTLTGLAVPTQRNLKISPYLLGSAVDQGGAAVDGSFDIGGDAKWSINPSLTLDLTANTDFAQVEVDQQQINLDRFNLFFPEKRPFFLENAGQFQVGSPGSVELFFSRRIGISSNGAQLPIRGGGRLTGRVGGVNVGLLNMQTGRVGEAAPANNFGVVRLSRDLPNRSSVGALFTSRRATGDFADADDNGQTYAVDARFGVGQRGTVQGYVARTDTPGETGREHAFSLLSEWRSEELWLRGGYSEVGEGFNPEVGFLQRRNYRKLEAFVFRTIRLQDNPLGFLEIRPHTFYNAFWNFSGFQQTGFLHLDTHWVWRAGPQIDTGMNVTREGVVRPFEIAPGVVVPTGTYDHTEAVIVANSNQAAPLSVQSRFTLGGFFGGTRRATSVGVTGRLGETFNTRVEWQRNGVNLPGGDFVTNLMATRVSYSFSPRVFTQALLQYNSQVDVWSTNLRFGWLQSSNTGFFIVLNDTQDLSETSMREFGRSLVVKYSHLLDVFQ